MVAAASLQFCSDYFDARSVFRDRAAQAGWTVESLPISAPGPQGQLLSIDAAISPGPSDGPLIILSSGLHGIEGFYGSAAQLAMLEEWKRTPSAAARYRVVLLHALNPYGFAWRRRFNESNLDLNRAFRLPGQSLSGCSEIYRRLDSFLNPPHAPSNWEPFRLKAAVLIARHGLGALQQAIAEGQYEFPRGLFFGGAESSETQHILESNWSRWLAASPRVIHLDFHTGLGPSGVLQLFPEHPLSLDQAAWLDRLAGRPTEPADNAQVAYHVRGGFGTWSARMAEGRNVIVLCAELGTDPPVAVLGGLRTENQAHHWTSPDDQRNRQAKMRLTELFCPLRPTWRQKAADETRAVLARLVAEFAG